jgi:hypothetical protein
MRKSLVLGSTTLTAGKKKTKRRNKKKAIPRGEGSELLWRGGRLEGLEGWSVNE